jgi:hypothetical protein
LIRPAELFGNPTSSHLVATQEKHAMKWWTLSCEVLLFILPKWFFTCRKNHTTHLQL